MVYTFAVYATLLVLQISHCRWLVRPSLVKRFGCCRTSIPKGITDKSTWYLLPVLVLCPQDGVGPTTASEVTQRCRGHTAVVPWENTCADAYAPPPRPVASNRGPRTTRTAMGATVVVVAADRRSCSFSSITPGGASPLQRIPKSKN